MYSAAKRLILGDRPTCVIITSLGKSECLESEMSALAGGAFSNIFGNIKENQKEH